MKKLILGSLIVFLGFCATGAEPVCTIEKEFWGHSYLKLVDVNGVEYKLTIPATGTSTRFKTRSGWYLIDSSGKILQYQDRVLLQTNTKKVQVKK